MANDIGKRNDHPIAEWDPLRAMRELLRWDPFRSARSPARDRDVWMPRFEVRETENSIRILADVPGVHTWERQFGEFTRTFTLPDHVDLDHVTSGLSQGVLTIVAPLASAAKPRKIVVGGASSKS